MKGSLSSSIRPSLHAKQDDFCPLQQAREGFPAQVANTQRLHKEAAFLSIEPGFQEKGKKLQNQKKTHLVLYRIH